MTLSQKFDIVFPPKMISLFKASPIFQQIGIPVCSQSLSSFTGEFQSILHTPPPLKQLPKPITRNVQKKNLNKKLSLHLYIQLNKVLHLYKQIKRMLV
jgi:hypothetical protein